MASHPLIDTYLAELAPQLPANIVDELADGLEETFQHHRRRGLRPAGAAAAATAEFGHPEQITRAFTRQSPGRRTALTLLATAPLFAALWSASLITAQAWTWPIPSGATVTFGATLFAVVAGLAAVATSRSYVRTRLAGPACGALILLDAAMLAAIALAAPAMSWPMALAIPASLARIGITAHSLPRILAR